MKVLGEIVLPFGASQKELEQAIAHKAGLRLEQIAGYEIRKKSVDARKKPAVVERYSILLPYLKQNAPDVLLPPASIAELNVRPFCKNRDVLVVGMGPAGLFAALTLCEYGANVTVIERGDPIEIRDEKVAELKNEGKLDPESNVQFGAGGAGTYSDGKLNSGIKSDYISAVLGELVGYGAPKEIRYDARAHVGTDILKNVVRGIEGGLIARGAVVRYRARLKTLIKAGNEVVAVWEEKNGSVEEKFSAVFLAIGHSARDTFSELERLGFPLEQKPFSLGVRIEHPQSLINLAQYGFDGRGSAEYRLAHRLSSGRGVYTFCMCPGGEVVAAASEEGGIATNGMSYHARNGVNANSALLVSVTPADFPSKHPLAGVEYQRRIERMAFRAGGGGYVAPAQCVEDFLKGKKSANLNASVAPSYRPGVVSANLRTLFPDYVSDGLAEGILAFDRKLKGFALPEAVLTAPETRSSSPLRILRDKNGRSLWGAVYPIGEGAGYAGGILSSATDGIGAAIRFLESNQQGESI